MTEPIRVLHVLGGLSIGGAESRIMDLYRNMDREKIQFDFLIHTTEKQHFEEEITKEVVRYMIMSVIMACRLDSEKKLKIYIGNE